MKTFMRQNFGGGLERMFGCLEAGSTKHKRDLGEWQNCNKWFLFDTSHFSTML